MNEPNQTSTASQSEADIARERTKQATAFGWTAGFTAFFAAGALSHNPTWPVAAGIAAVAAMVAFVCHSILNRK